MSAAGKTPFLEGARRKMHIKNEYVRESIAEVFGTAILCLFAVGAGIQYFLQSELKLNPTPVQPVLGGILGILTAILVTGGVSGAHINPAVTLGLAIVGETSWYKVPVFWVCQIVGGYIGAGFAVAMYYHSVTRNSLVNFYDELPAGAFSAVPDLPVGTVFLDQVICAFVLMSGVMAVVDKRNMGVPKHMIALLICLMVLGINLCFGAQAGAVMNPARDLGPRLMAMTMGYSDTAVMKNSKGEHIWIGMLLGPLVGASLGAIMYVLLVGAHLDDVEEGPMGHLQNGEGDAKEWRSTKFIPKAHVMPPQGMNSPIPPPQNVSQFYPQQPAPAFNNNNNNNGYGPPAPGPQGGYNNQGYAPRDEMRSRQGY